MSQSAVGVSATEAGHSADVTQPTGSKHKSTTNDGNNRNQSKESSFVSKTQSDENTRDIYNEKQARGCVDIAVGLFILTVLVFLVVAFVIFFSSGSTPNKKSKNRFHFNNLNSTLRNNQRVGQINEAIDKGTITKQSAAHKVLLHRFGEEFNNEGSGMGGLLTQKDFEDFNSTDDHLAEMDGHFDWWMFPYSQKSSMPQLALETYQDWYELVHLNFKYTDSNGESSSSSSSSNKGTEQSFIDLLIDGVNVLIRAEKDVNNDIVCNAHPRRKEKMLCSLWDFTRVLMAEKQLYKRLRVLKTMGDLMDTFNCMPKWRNSSDGNTNQNVNPQRLFQSNNTPRMIADKARASCPTEQANMNLILAQREIDATKIPAGLRMANGPQWTVSS